MKRNMPESNAKAMAHIHTHSQTTKATDPQNSKTQQQKAKFQRTENFLENFI